MKDNVNHPDHYKSGSGLEVIDVIDSFTSDLVGFKAAYTANIIKYILRWNKKNGLEDLKKAQWYLNRLIQKTEEECKTNMRFTGPEIVFYSKEDAISVLDAMKNYIEKFAFASIADYKQLCDCDANYTEDLRGWTNLDDAQIVHSSLNKDLWTIIMPRPIHK